MKKVAGIALVLSLAQCLWSAVFIGLDMSRYFPEFLGLVMRTFLLWFILLAAIRWVYLKVVGWRHKS